MRVAYVSDLLGVHDYRFLQSFISQGHEVFLITYADKSSIERNTFHISGFDVLKIPNIKIIHNSNLSSKKFVKYGLVKKSGNKILNLNTFLRQLFHLKRTLNEISPDVVLAVWVQTSGFLTALTGYHPLLVISWGSDILIDADLSAKLRGITNFTLRHCDKIICDAEIVKKKIAEILPAIDKDKIIMMPYGVDLSVFNPNNDRYQIRNMLDWDDKKILIMTRTFRPVYGIEYFLESLPLIINKNSDVRVIMVSTGPLEEKLHKMTNDLGISEYIHWTGYIAAELMPKYLCAADIYISCPISDSTSVSLLEALACGLPVVVTDCEANLEWIKDGLNGYIVPKRDKYKIAERINLLLGDENLRIEMRNQNLRLAQERANWHKNFDILQDSILSD